MSNKARKEGESIKQWRDRLRRENRNANTIDGGELNPVIVSESNPNNIITSGYRTLGSKSNDHRANQASLFGERNYNPNPSLAARLLNNITDGLKLTSPPTYKDGYGRTLNAEVPLSESAQGQELQRMVQTAMNAAAIASIPFGAKYLYLSPLATAAGIGTGYAASEGTGLILDGVDKMLNTRGYQLTDTQRAIPQFAAGFVGGAAGFNWGTNATKRAIETAMHTTGSPNPVPEIISRIKKTSKQDRLDALKYILTGKDETAGTLAETYDFDTHTSGRGYYTGLNSIHTRIGPITGEDDMVRTYLYRKPLNNMSEVTGPDKYGVHEGYVSENYPGRKVPVYELGPVSGSRTVSGDQVLSKSISSGNGDIIGTGLDGKTINYDAAGHIVETGKLATGETVQRQQDIWKFNSRDYMRRWGGYPGERFRQGVMKWGLDVVDYHGTPVIVRTPWVVQEPKTSKISLKKSEADLKTFLKPLDEDIQINVEPNFPVKNLDMKTEFNPAEWDDLLASPKKRR